MVLEPRGNEMSRAGRALPKGRIDRVDAPPTLADVFVRYGRALGDVARGTCAMQTTTLYGASSLIEDQHGRLWERDS